MNENALDGHGLRPAGGKRSEARWLTQTKVGGGHTTAPEDRGDCVPACIASILGLPIDAIANCHGEDWWERLNAECARHGYCIAVLDMKLAPPDGYWIASLPSLNLPVEPDGKQPWHCVVARGYALVHDPSMRRRYDDADWCRAFDADEVAEGWVLAPLDPTEFTQAPPLADRRSCLSR